MIFTPHAVSPESEGIPSGAIQRWVRALDELNSVNAFCLLRHGNLIASGAWAPYSLDSVHPLYSLSKSFVSCAVGIAVQEGFLSLDMPIANFFPNSIPENVDPRFLVMTVRNLLTMSTGHDRCSLEFLLAASDGDWPSAFFRSPLVFQPGERFVYNSGATYMLSALLKRAVGVGLVEFLRPRLLEPLGIRNFHWDRDPVGTETGGWGYALSVREIAAFAELLRLHGRWNGKQLVPEAYLREATSRQIDNFGGNHIDWRSGYGFQFWMTRGGNYRGDGALGQYALVLEKLGVTLAMTSGLTDMGRVLDLTFEMLVPAFSPSALPEVPAECQALSALTDSLAIPLAEGECFSSAAGTICGRWFRFKSNPIGLKRVRFCFECDRATAEFDFGSRTERMVGGFGKNILGELFFDRAESRKTACSAAWRDQRTLCIKAIEYETPFQETYEFCFVADKLTLVRSAQVYFRTAELPPLVAVGL